MKNLIMLFGLLTSHLYIQAINAQIGYQLVEGANSKAMGGIGVMFQGAKAIFQNPAGLITTSEPTLIAASEIRQGLKELRPMAFAAILPAQSAVFGMVYQTFHFEDYRESKLGLAYSRRMTSNFNIGLQLDYLRLRINEYGVVNLLTFEIGSNVLITKDLMLSAYVFNPVAVRINETEERTPSVFRLGLGYQLNTKVSLCLETEKDIYFAPSYKFGLAYQTTESINIRCGFRTQPTVFSLGIDYRIGKRASIDMALSNHTYLGATPAINLNYSFEKEKR
ncbi:MAG: hypothetical protein JNL70_24170 [Saprospiraceae bacterium]|nr:hypothetical protein [Saprospiraceae bacterium]